MIETQEAVDNITDILDVDGLDGAFVGKQKIIILSYISMWHMFNRIQSKCTKQEKKKFINLNVA